MDTKKQKIGCYTIIKQLGNGAFGRVYQVSQQFPDNQIFKQNKQCHIKQKIPQADQQEKEEIIDSKAKQPPTKSQHIPQKKQQHNLVFKTKAMKIQNFNQLPPLLNNQYNLFCLLKQATKGNGQNFYGYPSVYHFGEGDSYTFMVMDRLGITLDEFANKVRKNIFSRDCLIRILWTLMKIVEQIHLLGYIHRDIKPRNFMLQQPIKKGQFSNKKHLIAEEGNLGQPNYKFRLYPIDLGLAKPYVNPITRQHIIFKNNKKMVGTPLFCSVSAHRGFEQSRKDDLQSLIYSVIYLVRKLPWQNLTKNQASSIDIAKKGNNQDKKHYDRKQFLDTQAKNQESSSQKPQDKFPIKQLSPLWNAQQVQQGSSEDVILKLKTNPRIISQMFLNVVKTSQNDELIELGRPKVYSSQQTFVQKLNEYEHRNTVKFYKNSHSQQILPRSFWKIYKELIGMEFSSEPKYSLFYSWLEQQHRELTGLCIAQLEYLVNKKYGSTCSNILWETFSTKINNDSSCIPKHIDGSIQFKSKAQAVTEDHKMQVQGGKKIKINFKVPSKVKNTGIKLSNQTSKSLAKWIGQDDQKNVSKIQPEEKSQIK